MKFCEQDGIFKNWYYSKGKKELIFVIKGCGISDALITYACPLVAVSEMSCDFKHS